MSTPPPSSNRASTELVVTDSVTRLGNLLDFGQLIKAFGNN